MSLTSRILKYIWPPISKRKGAFFSIIFLFVVRVAVDFIIFPVYFKKLIDLISTNLGDRLLLLQGISHILIILVGLNLLVTITARSRSFFYIDFLTGVVKDLRNFAFQKVE